MDLNPDFPIVRGAIAMPNNWTLTLPLELNRRIDDGSLVLWNDELTFWIDIWHNDANLSMQQQADRILAQASAARREQKIERGDALLRLTYELDEEPSAISGHVISPTGYVQIAAHYDTPEARALGYRVIDSLVQK